MVSSSKTVVHRLLERAHSPDTAGQIFADKVQYRPQLLRPTSPSPLDAPVVAGGSAASAAAAAASSEALRQPGHDGREARRRHRRRKQEQSRQAHRAGKALRPKPLSSRQRRALGLYDVPVGSAVQPSTSPPQSYATFLPLHRLWLGYIREVLAPELRSTAWAAAGPAGAPAHHNHNPAAAPHTAAAIKLTAADFHGAAVLVTRSACVGRVGLRGIVVRDTRFVFQIVTPDNTVKMVPKEGTFFRLAIPVEAAGDSDGDGADSEAVFPTADDESAAAAGQAPRPTLVVELLGSQFMHRAPDRANRKFKQHFYKEL